MDDAAKIPFRQRSALTQEERAQFVPRAIARGSGCDAADDIDGHVLINDVAETNVAPGNFYSVEITDSLEYDLVGKIV